MEKQLEYRTVPLLTMEVRSDVEQRAIVGHAAVFDTIGDGGFFKEKIAPGAFEKSLKTDDVRALFNHDVNFVLGRNKAGTLKLKEDDQGLWVDIDPPDTQYARDLMVSIGRGDISQMSFAFQIVSEERTTGKGNEPDLYTLTEVKLWDVSPVTYPFYKETDVSLNSRQLWQDTQRVERVRKHLLRKRHQMNRRF